jgi:hypothetical protein
VAVGDTGATGSAVVEGPRIQLRSTVGGDR